MEVDTCSPAYIKECTRLDVFELGEMIGEQLRPDRRLPELESGQMRE